MVADTVFSVQFVRGWGVGHERIGRVQTLEYGDSHESRLLMADEPKFFSVHPIEGVPEIILGTADFVSRPIIVMAKEELTTYIDTHKPQKLVINFKHVGHISSEFIAAMIHIQDHVVGHGGHLKFSHMNETVKAPFRITNLAGRLFMIYGTTPEAIDAF